MPASAPVSKSVVAPQVHVEVRKSRAPDVDVQTRNTVGHGQLIAIETPRPIDKYEDGSVTVSLRLSGSNAFEPISVEVPVKGKTAKDIASLIENRITNSKAREFLTVRSGGTPKEANVEGSWKK